MDMMERSLYGKYPDLHVDPMVNISLYWQIANKFSQAQVKQFYKEMCRLIAI